MRSKQRAAYRKFFSLAPTPTSTPLSRPDKNLTKSLEQKISYTDIQKYTDICFQSTSRMQFLGLKKWCSGNVFSGNKQKTLAGKIVKWETLLAVLREHIIFHVKWVEVRKMSEDFWAKLYCEMSDLFR